MKTIPVILLILLVSKFASAQYKPTDQGSALTFTIANFGFDVKGSFRGLQGAITFDAQNPAAATFDVTIDAATVNTDNSLRDKHLKGESYFDVANYPRIRLASTKILASKNGVYGFTGKLTMKGKSKDVSFHFTVAPAADGYNFNGTFKINRKDFDIGGTSTIANELQVQLSVHAVKA